VRAGQRADLVDVLGAREAIEHRELLGRDRQLAVLVLPVEREQPAADLAQVLGRRRAPLDERPRAPGGGHPAPEDDLVLPLREPVAQLRQRFLLQQVRGRRECALDVGLRGTGPHDPRARAPPEQEVERVGEHGLPRAGLAGHHRQAGAQAQLGALDQQQVLDAQLAEHAHGLPPGSDRLATSGSLQPLRCGA
jgi:hypothetical protein